jgi:hypothetical protein
VHGHEADASDGSNSASAFCWCSCRHLQNQTGSANALVWRLRIWVGLRSVNRVRLLPLTKDNDGDGFQSPLGVTYDMSEYLRNEKFIRNGRMSQRGDSQGLVTSRIWPERQPRITFWLSACHVVQLTGPGAAKNLNMTRGRNQSETSLVLW